MATHSQIKSAWYEFVSQNVAPEVTVVFAEAVTGNPSPRPPKPYVTIKVISGPIATGLDEYRLNVGGTFDVTGLRKYTVNLQAFGVEAYDILATLQTLIDNREKRAVLTDQADISVVNRGAVTDLSELLETGYESRASLDITFNSSTAIDTEITPIEKAAVSGTISKDDSSSIDVPEFEIPPD